MHGGTGESNRIDAKRAVGEVMRRYVTLKDVAKEAGTTAATVSYVLSGNAKRYISPAMRERVTAAVEATGYIKSMPASSLHGKGKGVIAVLVPQFSNQYFTALMLAVESVVEREGYLLSISNTFDDPDRERDIIVKMAQQRVDGYILTPTTEGARNTETIRRVGIPLVLLDRPLQGVTGPAEESLGETAYGSPEGAFTEVLPDNYRAGYVLGEYLGHMGHTRVAYLDWDSGHNVLDERRRGFWDGLASATGSLPVEVTLAGEFSVEGGYTLAERVHREHPGVTAWCLGYNVPGKGSVDFLYERGIVPGRDLSVVMIGSPDWARAGANDFTVVDLGAEAQGRSAAEQLLCVLSDPDTEPRQIITDCHLQVGSSVLDLRIR